MASRESTIDPADIPLKRCTICGTEYPLTTEYFEWRKRENKWRSRCLVCKRAAYNQWVAHNRAHKRQYNATWKRAHPEKNTAGKTLWAQKHPERDKKNKANHYQVHCEQIKKRSKDHYQANRARHYALSLKWMREHPEAVRAMTARRRAHKKHAPVNDFTTTQWETVKQAYGHRCAYCGRKMQRLTMDHITPLSKGGNHTMNNIVPACRSCNSRKHAGPVLKPIQPLLL